MESGYEAQVETDIAISLPERMAWILHDGKISFALKNGRRKRGLYHGSFIIEGSRQERQYNLCKQRGGFRGSGVYAHL